MENLPRLASSDPYNRITLRDWIEVQDYMYAAERRGFRIDPERVEPCTKQAQELINEAESRWYSKYPDVSWTSPKQLMVAFYKEQREIRDAAIVLKLNELESNLKDLEVDLEKKQKAGGPVLQVTNRIESTKKKIQSLAETLEGKNTTRFNFPRPPSSGKKYTTDKDALEWLMATQNADLVDLDDLRKLTRSKQFFESISKFARSTDADLTFRIHPNIKRGATSGRLSTNNPSVLNVPKDSRRDKFNSRSIFLASPGHELVVADFSQLEQRILAHVLEELFGETKLREDLEGDTHAINAIRVFGPLRPDLGLDKLHWKDIKKHPNPEVRQCRDDVKAIAYGWAYGKTLVGFASTLRDYHTKMPIGLEKAQRILDLFLECYPAQQKYSEYIWQCFDVGYVETVCGRRRDMGRPSPDEHRSFLNYPFQGTGADIVDKALILAMRRIREQGLTAHLLLQVHDELVLEAPKDQAQEVGAILLESMRSCVRLRCPLDASVAIGQDWSIKE